MNPVQRITPQPKGIVEQLEEMLLRPQKRWACTEVSTDKSKQKDWTVPEPEKGHGAQCPEFESDAVAVEAAGLLGVCVCVCMCSPNNIN